MSHCRCRVRFSRVVQIRLAYSILFYLFWPIYTVIWYERDALLDVSSPKRQRYIGIPLRRYDDIPESPPSPPFLLKIVLAYDHYVFLRDRFI